MNEVYAVEAFFVEGDRTNPTEIVEMMRTGTFLVLDLGSAIGGAIYVTHAAPRAYFGMLAVSRALQGKGIGKRLVRIAEAVAEAAGCTVMTMKIVNLREELGRWYRSLGYRVTGTAPYAVPRSVTRVCHFIEMARPLGMATADIATAA
ncbi:MAG: GNAT family N-acetyltransferase [Kofleriaceae bacterium]